jgi:putative transposase
MLNRRYATDLTDAAWELVKPLLPAARYGGRPRTTDVRDVVNANLLSVANGLAMAHASTPISTMGTVCHYFRSWENTE